MWLALAVPLIWWSRSAGGSLALWRVVAAVTVLFGTSPLIFCLHKSVMPSHEVEFLSAVVWLAVLGMLGLERALAGRPVWRRTARWSWGLLLAFSVSFNVCTIFEASITSHIHLGLLSNQNGQLHGAVDHLQKALALQPDNATARSDLGLVLFRQGRMDEALVQLAQAVRLKPDFAEGRKNLRLFLSELGVVAEAVGYYEKALMLDADSAAGHYNLGTGLLLRGKVPEAVGHLEQAVRLNPEDTKARNNLGVALVQLGDGLTAQGKWAEAIASYERAIQMQPNNAQANDSLGVALSRIGRFADALARYRRALEIDSSLVTAQNNLAWLLATCADGAVRNGARAVELAEGANKLAGGKEPGVLDTLAATYAETGRLGEAVETAQKAIELAQGAGQAEVARQIQARLRLYQAGRPYHEGPGAEQ